MWGDDWDIFDPLPEEEPPASFITSSVFTSSLEAAAEGGLRNDSLFNRLAGQPLYNSFRFFLKGKAGYSVTLFEKLILNFAGEMDFSNKELITLAGDNPGSPALYKAGINNLFLKYAIGERLFLLAGIRKINTGNYLYLNPVNYLVKYYADPNSPGASSYPVIEAALPWGSTWFTLQLIPLLYDKTAVLKRIEFFQDSYEANILRLMISHYTAGYLIEANFFLEENYTFDALNWAAALESVLPLTANFILELQGIVYTGRPRFQMEALTGFEPYRLLTTVAGSEKEPAFDLLGAGTFTLFDFFNLDLGLLFQSRALPIQEWAAISQTLTALNAAVPDFVLTDPILSSYTGLHYSPLPFLKYVVLLGLEFPALARDLSLNIFTFLSPVDFSLQTYLTLHYNITDEGTLFVKGSFTWGGDNSAFNLITEKANLNLGFEINY